MRSASLIPVTSRSSVPSRCGSVPRMSADQRDYSDDNATKSTTSEICDTSVYYGVKESHFWRRSDGENIRSAARDKPEPRQRWQSLQMYIRYHISLMIGYEFTVIIRRGITVADRHAILVLLSDMIAVLLSDMISCY